jgi:hypothetical protein
METPYTLALPKLNDYTRRNNVDLVQDLKFPTSLLDENMHLDPDFQHLTYGDNGKARGKGVASLQKGDFIAFYAGLKPILPYSDRLMYALIGYYEVDKITWVNEIPPELKHINAHTRKKDPFPQDVVVHANPEKSGKLKQCIPIGEYRNRSYRVTKDLLETWGGLTIKDGYLQRSRNPPFFKDPELFQEWFKEKKPVYTHFNF